MNTNQIIVIAAIFAVLAIRLYQKYMKKDKTNPESRTKTSSGSEFSSSSKEDDYEPYSKK
jgi:Tfp pilus assembly major pilin PilA